MTEEDTFNALIRIPFSEMMKIVIKINSVRNGQYSSDHWWNKEVFEPNGWTADSYSTALAKTFEIRNLTK